MMKDEKRNPSLPSLPGTYALVLRFSKRLEIVVGRLGVLEAQPGYYVYVGSALGPGGLAARVGRHLCSEKTLRWHIDYLRAEAQVEEVWYATGKSNRECRWARRVTVTAGGFHAPGGIRGLGLRLPVASALLYPAAVRGRFSEEATQPEDRAAAASRWIAIWKRLRPLHAGCGAGESDQGRPFDTGPCFRPSQRGFRKTFGIAIAKRRGFHAEIVSGCCCVIISGTRLASTSLVTMPGPVVLWLIVTNRSAAVSSTSATAFAAKSIRSLSCSRRCETPSSWGGRFIARPHARCCCSTP